MYHRGIYFRDTLLSRNPVESHISNFSQSPNFVGCLYAKMKIILANTIIHTIIF